MTTTSVQLDSLQIGKRHRTLDRSKVKSLAKSIEAIGLQHPISVHVGDGDTVHLVAGLHRVEAAKLLGWEHIDGILVELSDLDRELWEIDENLMRADLSTDEKRAHLRRRKEIWEKRCKSVVAHDAPKLISKRGRAGEGRPQGFAAETAAETGISKSQINRLIAEPKPGTPISDDGEGYSDLPDCLARSKRGRGKKAAKGADGKARKTEPKRYTARPLPKPRSGKPVIGLEAARRHYLDQCAGPDVDLDAEIDLVVAALREIAGRRGTKATA